MENQFRVKKSERGVRLDNFLYSKMSGWSHKKIKLAIDQKKVFINGKNVFISSWNLKPNDKVVLLADQTTQKNDKPGRYQFVQVLYEDPHIMVTNKPAFVDFDSFVTQVNAYLKRVHGGHYYPYLGQMHRLDKETSGVLIFTKKKSANVLSDQFRRRVIKKYYMTFVWGRVEAEHGIIKDRLEKKKFEGGKKVHIVKGAQGKESVTEFWVEERYDQATCLRVLLGTGRTHQIRVHLSNQGFPLIGDKLYGLSAEKEKDLALKQTKLAKPLIKRQALHAYRVEFYHPITNKKMKVEAPLPPDMVTLRDKLRGILL